MTALTVAALRETESKVRVYAPGPKERMRLTGALHASDRRCETAGEPSEKPPALAVCWLGGEDERIAELRDLRERLGDLPIVVVLTGRVRPGHLRKMLRCGADGIVLEPDVEATLPPTVDAVLRGQVVAPKEMLGTLAGAALTFRERQVLGMVVLGSTNRQIADELYLAESTIKTHLSSAFSKLGVRSRAEATALILDPEEGVGLGVVGISHDGRANGAPAFAPKLAPA